MNDNSMTNSLTSRAIQTLAFAAKEAKRLNHSYIGTEHLLLGLLEQDGVLDRLKVVGIDGKALRKDLLDGIDPVIGAPETKGFADTFKEAKEAINKAVMDTLMAQARQGGGLKRSQLVAPASRTTSKDYYLLGDDTCFWQIAVVAEDPPKRGETGLTDAPNEMGYPQEIPLPLEIEGPFTANLMNRAPAFPYKRYASSSWTGWAISKAEYDQILRLRDLASTAAEFNRLKAYRVPASS